LAIIAHNDGAPHSPTAGEHASFTLIGIDGTGWKL